MLTVLEPEPETLASPVTTLVMTPALARVSEQQVLTADVRHPLHDAAAGDATGT